MKILIDNGHGVETPGKRSPDGRLREYRYTREIAAALCARLVAAGYDAELIVQEENDVPLNRGKDSRVARVNRLCRILGAGNCLLVSIHCNAAPPNNGQWHNARGWCVLVAQNASASSKRLAGCLAVDHVPILRRDNRHIEDGEVLVEPVESCRGTTATAHHHRGSRLELQLGTERIEHAVEQCTE